MSPSVVSASKAVAKSGITTTDTGDRHIPSSVRPDGTVRKEIRVRPGYRPPEDVEVYKNRTAEAWKNRGKTGVPGAEAMTQDDAASAAATKNTKRKEARKKAAAAAAKDDTATDANKTETLNPPEQEPLDPEAEKAKEARKLSKKLRQARDLKDKKEKGDSLLPEQFEKVIRINELIRQLDNLGFDTNGEKKSEDSEPAK